MITSMTSSAKDRATAWTLSRDDLLVKVSKCSKRCLGAGSMASKHWKKRDPRHLKNGETKIGSLVTTSLYIYISYGFCMVLHWMRLYPQRPYQSLKGGCLSQAHNQGATIDWLVAVGFTVGSCLFLWLSVYICHHLIRKINTNKLCETKKQLVWPTNSTCIRLMEPDASCSYGMTRGRSEQLTVP